MESGHHPYVLALDLGVASIGWAIAPCDEDGNVVTIDRVGTFVYPSPISEVKKGRRVTNRSNRGAQRRARRRLQHFHARRKQLTRALIELGWWPSDKSEQELIRSREILSSPRQADHHPIQIKCFGLAERLDDYALGKVLLHYQRHRGYLSTAHLPALLEFKLPANLEGGFKETEQDAEEGPKKLRLNDALKSTRAQLGDRTVSQFQWELVSSQTSVRARKEYGKPSKSGIVRRNGDIKTHLRFDRWMYIEEFRKLWDIQAAFRPELTPELRNRIEALVFHQDPLESKEDAGVIGNCEYLPNYRRCRKGELVSERSRLLQMLNNLSIVAVDKDPRTLEPEERHQALALLMSTEEASWAQMREAVGLAPSEFFSDEPILSGKRGAKGKGKGRSTIKGSKWAASIIDTLGLEFHAVAEGAYDDLVHDLISIGNQLKLKERLAEHYGISAERIEALLALTPPKGYGNVCARVLRRTEPSLRDGLNWHDALAAAGYRQSYQREIESKDRLEFERDWTTGNPSVDAAVRWSARVVNCIVERYGKPQQINVELPRLMALGNDAREKIWQEIKEREAKNKEYAKKIEEAGYTPSRKYVRMVQLWEEANQVSPYDPETPIPDIKTLLETCDIDHIVPKSHSADDSMGNQTICLRSHNAAKGGRTPFETWGDTPQWSKIEQHLQFSCRSMNPKKRKRILAKERPEMGMEGRMEAAIGYIGRVMKEKLETLTGPQHVMVVNGQVTFLVRQLLGLNSLLPRDENTNLHSEAYFADEKNRDDLRHHALDAASIALVNRSLSQRLARYFQDVENWRRFKEKGERREFTLEEPFPHVRQHIEQLLATCPVVHATRRKNTGELHKAMMEPLAQFEDVRGKPGSHEVRGKYLFRFDADGKVDGAWDKGSVHHGLILEGIGGKRKPPVTVSLFEVAQRMEENRQRKLRGERPLPLIRPEAHLNAVTRFVMSLANGDTVEYTGEKGAGPGYYRVGTIAVGNQFEITLFPVTVARSDPKLDTSIRLTSLAELANLDARVVLDALGEVIFREPATGG